MKIRHLCTLLISALTLAGCQNKTENNIKDMNTLTFNERQAACMSAIACNEASGDQSLLYDAINEGPKSLCPIKTAIFVVPTSIPTTIFSLFSIFICFLLLSRTNNLIIKSQIDKTIIIPTMFNKTILVKIMQFL